MIAYQTLPACRRRPYLSGFLLSGREALEDEKGSLDVKFMVYGVYNAGKSTLINALLHSEEATTGGIPLTDKVSTYTWGS